MRTDRHASAHREMRGTIPAAIRLRDAAARARDIAFAELLATPSADGLAAAQENLADAFACAAAALSGVDGVDIDPAVGARVDEALQLVESAANAVPDRRPAQLSRNLSEALKRVFMLLVVQSAELESLTLGDALLACERCLSGRRSQELRKACQAACQVVCDAAQDAKNALTEARYQLEKSSAQERPARTAAAETARRALRDAALKQQRELLRWLPEVRQRAPEILHREFWRPTVGYTAPARAA
jgi:hypothetical protein